MSVLFQFYLSCTDSFTLHFGK